MAPRALPWALALLGASLALSSAPAPEPPPEKLCGHHFVRALVRVCGGPLWSPEDVRSAAGGDRELLQWLERRHLQGPVADGVRALGPALQPPRPSRSRRSHRATLNPARHCCLLGCTHRSLLALCPH